MTRAAFARFAWLAPILLVAAGCASRPQQPAEYVPPRLDLTRYTALGILEFSSPDKTGLGAMAAEEFVAALHAAQPATPLLGLGALPGAAHGKVVPEKISEVAERERVDAVFVGEISEAESKPRVAFWAIVLGPEVKCP